MYSRNRSRIPALQVFLMYNPFMNKTYIPALLAVTLLATLHFMASAGQWYVRYTGFDILMHVLGGIGLTLSIYWFLATFFPRYKASFWSLMFLTVFAGFAWELFEAVNNIAGAPVGTKKYYYDSAKDLVNDTLGAIIAAYFLKK